MSISPSRPAAVAETHSGVVFFFGDRAYKAKKPVDLGFLDFTTLASRRLACHRETELNRRLAPDVYLGVADVLGPDSEVCEHLVVMRRMPDERRLSALASAGADVHHEIREIAQVVAQFHRRAPSPRTAMESASVAGNLDRWEQLTRLVHEHGDTNSIAAADEIHSRAVRYLSGRSALFESRVEDGHARDGHGDLLADDIFLLEDGPRILDCLDFDERLRCGDVLADVAFLAMDLEHLGRPDLASTMLQAYREASADGWPASLAHHYIAQRALVRAGVMLVRDEQGAAGAADSAAAFLDLARDHLEAGTVRLLGVSGLPGTGKSTVAAGVTRQTDAVLLRSDEIRRQLPSDPDGDRYDRRSIDRTYDEMLARAADLAGRGHDVVLDATWMAPRHRLAVEAAARAASADLRAVECQVPSAVADQRIEARSRRGSDSSEVTVGVAEQLRREWHPWAGAVPVDTTLSIERCIANAVEAFTSTQELQHV